MRLFSLCSKLVNHIWCVKHVKVFRLLMTDFSMCPVAVRQWKLCVDVILWIDDVRKCNQNNVLWPWLNQQVAWVWWDPAVGPYKRGRLFGWRWIWPFGNSNVSNLQCKLSLPKNPFQCISSSQHRIQHIELVEIRKKLAHVAQLKILHIFGRGEKGSWCCTWLGRFVHFSVNITFTQWT